ncbi:MAG: prenyltransferase [Actinomycetota bacterium]|nr:prenyltransferase [Actinomycetota bacterium]
MAGLSVLDAVGRARDYPHGVISYVGRDGYPVSVAAGVGRSGAAGTSPDELVLGPLSPDLLPPEGTEVGVIFSHIRPQPGVGYDERRYVNVWGPAALDGDLLRVRPVRATGWDEAETPFFEYAERNVATGRAYLEAAGAKPRLSAFWTVFLATRLPFLTATVVPVALGGAVAAAHHRFVFGWWLLCLLAGVAAHLGINIINDVADADSGSDGANVNPTPFSGGSRVIQYGLVTRRTMAASAAALYAVTAVIGVVLALTRTTALLWVGALALVLGYGYTARPFRLVHRGLGEPVVALGFGPIMAAGTYLAVTRQFSAETVYASLPVGLLCAMILYVNQVPDRIADAATGKRTLIVRWPAARVVTGYAVVCAVAFALIALGPALQITPVPTLLGLGGAWWAVKTYRPLAERYNTPYALIPVMQSNVVAHLATGLLLVAGYLVSAAL